MKWVIDVCPCVYGPVKCTKCLMSSDIGGYKTDGINIFCPICGYKMGVFKQKKKQESE